jgi:hypothetical protein
MAFDNHFCELANLQGNHHLELGKVKPVQSFKILCLDQSVLLLFGHHIHPIIDLLLYYFLDVCMV